MVYFLQGPEANIILLNPIRVVPNVAKYFPPTWLWVTPVWGGRGGGGGGIYWITQRESEEEGHAGLCNRPTGRGSKLGGDSACPFPFLRPEKEEENILFLVITAFH